jgi:hypothetical protein
MERKAIRPLPRGIVRGRELINELSSMGFIQVESKNLFWNSAQLLCNPFEGIIEYDRQDSSFTLKIQLGRTPDTYLLQEVLGSLPIPVEVGYSLEPESTIYIEEKLSVSDKINSQEVLRFIQEAIIKTLVVTQSLIVYRVFTPNSLDKFFQHLPNPNSTWNFGDLAEKVLKTKA